MAAKYPLSSLWSLEPSAWKRKNEKKQGSENTSQLCYWRHISGVFHALKHAYSMSSLKTESNFRSYLMNRVTCASMHRFIHKRWRGQDAMHGLLSRLKFLVLFIYLSAQGRISAKTNRYILWPRSSSSQPGQCPNLKHKEVYPRTVHLCLKLLK